MSRDKAYPPQRFPENEILKEMNSKEFYITDASPEDASLIADAILAAIGDEITDNLAGDNNSRQDVHGIFSRLAACDDSQYSFRNTRIARTPDGKAIGVCISYDGADLKRLRRPFFKEANDILGWGLTDDEVEQIPGETDPDEFYLDTLMTLPEYRGKGVGKALIADASAKAAYCGKPLGLLCDIDNARAERLYHSAGFRRVGLRPFAGHQMNHLRLHGHGFWADLPKSWAACTQGFH